MANAAILLCGGSGKRMQGQVLDKVLAKLDGVPIFSYSLSAFCNSGVVTRFVIIYRDEAQKAVLAPLVVKLSDYEIFWEQGGKERQNSVFNGLNALPDDTETVFIHDCARPLVAPAMLNTLLSAARQNGAAVLAHRVIDTIKQVSELDSHSTTAVLEDVPRQDLWAMETPQVFKYSLIHEAYSKVIAEDVAITDDTAAASHMGHRVSLVENILPNPKLTTPSDLALLEFLLQQHRETLYP